MGRYVKLAAHKQTAGKMYSNYMGRYSVSTRRSSRGIISTIYNTIIVVSA